MSTTSPGVALADQSSGSAFFHRALAEAVARFGAAFEGARFPADPKRFKQDYADALVRFEAARLASPQRLDVARFLRAHTLGGLRWVDERGTRPLAEALADPTPPPATERREPTGTAGLVPEIPLDGQVYRGAEVHRVIDRLHQAHHVTDAAARALRWVVDRGTLELRGERFALLGAHAELSPVELLLQAGASVRWIDVRPPELTAHAGALTWSTQPDDLLAAPGRVVAALREFAAEGPVHLGLFAYAPGASREVRLAATMDALLEVLGPSVVKSASLYISPTSPAEAQPEDLRVAADRALAPRWWQRLAQTLGTLKAPGSVGGVARGIISLQGASYQAAQYLTKEISGEVLAADGLGGRPLTLSYNVAGITNTRSLSHPLFQIAFQGAPEFWVRIFEPPTTRAVNGLLLLHDLLNPEAPGAAGRTFPTSLERVKAVRSQQVHGGAYDLPWSFESSVRTAAVLGLGKRPELLFRRR